MIDANPPEKCHSDPLIEHCNRNTFGRREGNFTCSIDRYSIVRQDSKRADMAFALVETRKYFAEFNLPQTPLPGRFL